MKTNTKPHDESQLYDSPEEQDMQESPTGHAPVTGIDQNTNTLDHAQEMGLYDDASEENPKPLNIAEEIEKDEKTHRES